MSDWVTLRDSLGVTLRPIERWPQKPTVSREYAPFRSSAGPNRGKRTPLAQTLEVLERELRMLKARNVVLQIAIRENGFRLDGLPRHGATAEHPGVILSFDSEHGPLALPCDTFTHWHDNLRAIALHLENLRKAGLYGVGRHGEQYKGWKALGAGDQATPATSEPFTPETAARHIADVVGAESGASWGEIYEDPQAFREARGCAYSRVHPDYGGTDDDFRRVREADLVLKRHHAL